MSKRKKRKPMVKLEHDQKRQLAREVVNGKVVKQVAVEYGVSLNCAHKIVQRYTIVARYEKFPL